MFNFYFKIILHRMIHEIKKIKIMKLHNEGVSYEKISKKLCIPKSTIQSIISPNYRKTNLPSGPKPKITKRISKCIKQ